MWLRKQIWAFVFIVALFSLIGIELFTGYTQGSLENRCIESCEEGIHTHFVAWDLVNSPERDTQRCVCYYATTGGNFVKVFPIGD